MQAYLSMLMLADAGAELRQDDLKNWQAMIGREQHLWGDRALAEHVLGKYREWDIALGMPDGSQKSIGAEWTKVQVEMDALFRDFQSDLELGANPLVVAAEAHHRYERIHPFGDGNGRSGRLLALYILRRAGVGPVIFLNFGKSTDYYPCFTTSDPWRMVAYFEEHQVESWD